MTFSAASFSLRETLLVAGHSHVFAMGAPQSYKGDLGIHRIEVDGKEVQFLMEEWKGNRTPVYWKEVSKRAGSQPTLIVFNGNQHYGEFLFPTDPPIDFLGAGPRGQEVQPNMTIVPRRLIRAHFSKSLEQLRASLSDMSKNARTSTFILGTPAPKPDLEKWASYVRASEYFRSAAKRRGLDIEKISFNSPLILLKMWREVQSLLKEVADEYGAHFIPVPEASLDEHGFLRREFHADVTHANAAYGSLVLRSALRSVFGVADE